MRGRRGGDAAAGAGRFRGSKWVATAASIWIQCTSGPSYCFGIYSSLLKSSQGYDQSTLDSVAFFKDVGANVGLLSGLLYSTATSSDVGSWRGSGPWVVHAAGAAQCFVGYFMMWLAVTGVAPRTPVALMSLYMFLAAHAQTFFNTANVVTAVQNFPRSRGTVVGIMKKCFHQYHPVKSCRTLCILVVIGHFSEDWQVNLFARYSTKQLKIMDGKIE